MRNGPAKFCSNSSFTPTGRREGRAWNLPLASQHQLIGTLMEASQSEPRNLSELTFPESQISPTVTGLSGFHVMESEQTQLESQCVFGSAEVQSLLLSSNLGPKHSHRTNINRKICVPVPGCVWPSHPMQNRQPSWIYRTSSFISGSVGLGLEQCACALRWL